MRNRRPDRLEAAKLFEILVASILQEINHHWKLQVTDAYPRETTPNRLLEFAVYWRLLRFTGDHWSLLEITGDYWRFT